MTSTQRSTPPDGGTPPAAASAGPPLLDDPVRLRRARFSLILVFALHAAVFAAWTPHVADVRRELGLSEAQLGIALAGEPVGSIAAMLLVGALVVRFGSSPVLRWALRAYAVVTALVGLADSLLSLFLLLGLWGAVLGTLNVAMNTQAVNIERSYRRPVLAGFHASWSLGAFAGAALGSFGNSTTVPLWAQLGATAGAALLIIELVSRWFFPRRNEDPPTAARVVRPTGELARLAAIALCSLLCEGAAVVWSAVYFRDVVEVGPGLAGIGYAAYSLSMFLGRVLGDRAALRFAPVQLIRMLAVVSGLGFLLALLVPVLPVAVIGFALLGLGLSCIMPIVVRVAGQLPSQSTGPAVAAVTSAGWLGVVSGPPLIGAIAAASTLPVALAVLVLLTAFIFLLAPVARPARAVPAT